MSEVSLARNPIRPVGVRWWKLSERFNQCHDLANLQIDWHAPARFTWHGCPVCILCGYYSL